MNNSTDELGYSSSAPDLVQQDVATPHEQAEIPTLTRLKALHENRKAYFLSVESISLDPKDLEVFSAEAQIAINKKVVFHIQELEALEQSTITKVKELERNARN